MDMVHRYGVVQPKEMIYVEKSPSASGKVEQGGEGGMPIDVSRPYSSFLAKDPESLWSKD